MIYVINMTGLGSRIKNVVAAIRRGHVRNDIVVCEPQFQHHYLFNINQLATRRLFVSHYYQTWMLLNEDDPSPQLHDMDKKTVIYSPFQDTPNYYENIIDYQYHNIKPEVIDKWLSYFDRLEWSPYIMNEVYRLFDFYNLEGITGVHIRSWYDVTDKKFLERLYDIRQYAELIESLGVDRIFLCMDHINILSELKAILDPNIEIITRENFLPGHRHVAEDYHVDVMIYAAIDLHLLGRCKNIIGSYQSNFTELAWWLGRCKANVFIPEPKVLVEIDE